MSKQKSVLLLSEEQKNYYGTFNVFLESEKDIEKLQKLTKSFELIKKIMTELLPERTEAYYSIVKDTAVLFRQLGINNALEVCNMFTYMLWSGIFSKNNQYGFNIKTSNIIKYLNDLGMTIINGEGVCINNTLLLNNILNEAGYSSTSITNSLKKGGKLEYKPDIERNMKNKFKNALIMILLAGKKSDRNSGNHICEIIEFEGNHYIYDPTNLCVFPTNGTVNTTVLNGSYELEIKPYGSILLGKLPLEDLCKIRDVFKTNISYKDASLITKELFEKDLDIFRSNMGIFTDFRRSIEDRIDTVLDGDNNKLRFMDFMSKFIDYSDDERMVKAREKMK